MKAFKIAVAVVLCALVAKNALAAESVTRASGGLAQAKDILSGVATVNSETSIEREWITVHDDSIHVDLHGTIGIEIIDVRAGGYRYLAKFSITAKEDITAIEVKFILFDIWGDWTQVLKATYVREIVAGAKIDFDPRWLASAREVKVHYASIAYIARVLTKSGRVIEANTETIIEEARKFSKKFSEGDLEPDSSAQ